MYEHVTTGCKHIPPSEQPLQFQSGYFLNKPPIPQFPHVFMEYIGATSRRMFHNDV